MKICDKLCELLSMLLTKEESLVDFDRGNENKTPTRDLERKMEKFAYLKTYLADAVASLMMQPSNCYRTDLEGRTLLSVLMSKLLNLT